MALVDLVKGAKALFGTAEKAEAAALAEANTAIGKTSEGSAKTVNVYDTLLEQLNGKAGSVPSVASSRNVPAAAGAFPDAEKELNRISGNTVAAERELARIQRMNKINELGGHPNAEEGKTRFADSVLASRGQTVGAPQGATGDPTTR